MILFNPTTNKVEFFFDGQLFKFEPKELRTLPDHIAIHALERSKVPLVEHTPMYGREVVSSDIYYNSMPWKDLLRMASARKLFKPGTPRVEVERLLEEYDRKQRGTL